ncbi:hypothetical protein [Noviherbaspirillum suwonense]|uniref:DUF2486 domain-containing protein n=1 Tax=Noviherbaspirillum suwonense TaxID=1224511 RepID=A0ABY1Q2E2_9BURK|nr:hypothetical protein [Noviherbaspirillum suwonense]SMP57147.1 hypothetical protein SAMN06295970_10543 [Noviherbaspirillum suwonense]
MSIPPRDAGIPMLTEVIEDDIMDFVGPPLPVEAKDDALADMMPPAPHPPETQSAPAVVQKAGGGYASHGVGIQYGPPAQFAPSYPLPLKPAAPPASPGSPGPAEQRLAQAAEQPAERAAGPVPAGAPLPSPMSEDEWQRMERRVRERILGQLLSRTDAMLEERIRSSVAGVLEQAVDGLAATLRASLHKTLEDVVSRAVAQEITRLQSTKK